MWSMNFNAKKNHSHSACTSSYFLHDIIQMMHGSEWTLKYDEPKVENVTPGRSPSVTFNR